MILLQVFWIFFYLGSSFSSFAKSSTSDCENLPPCESPWKVSKTWVVNLDERRDRMLKIGKTLVGMQVPYERFSAINFHHGMHPLAEMVFKTRLHPNSSMDLSLVRKQMRRQRPGNNWGSVGCWQSHLQIYFEIANGPPSMLPGPFLILEDDAVFATNISDYLSHRYLKEHIPKDWELLMLAHGYLTCHNDTIKDDYCLISHAYTTTGYLVRDRHVAQKLIAIYNSKGSSIADVSWNAWFMNKTLLAYAVLPRPVRQNTKSPSNIRLVTNASIY